jgi:hypothetical protein
MPYELRIAGRSSEQFGQVGEALARARAILRNDADVQLEIIDLTTNRPYGPAAGAEDREVLSREVGF